MYRWDLAANVSCAWEISAGSRRTFTVGRAFANPERVDSRFGIRRRRRRDLIRPDPAKTITVAATAMTARMTMSFILVRWLSTVR
jgi:hypothetical protein